MASAGGQRRGVGHGGSESEFGQFDEADHAENYEAKVLELCGENMIKVECIEEPDIVEDRREPEGG